MLSLVILNKIEINKKNLFQARTFKIFNYFYFKPKQRFFCMLVLLLVQALLFECLFLVLVLVFGQISL